MVVISAMFPMIPQYFFNSNNLNDGLVKVKKKRKIVVTSVIDVDVESSDFSVQEVLEPVQEELEVQVFCQDNTIKCNSLNWFWLQQVHLAEDCHSYNIILYKESISSLLKIKTVRKILPEDKLVLWFSRDLLLTLQIPFLLPNNILSEKQYICHLCRFHCEMPNPIKIHLSLECGKNSKSVLWNRLRHICSEKFNKEENLSPTLSPLLPHTELKESSNHSSSAFKPYKKVEKDKLQDKMCALLPNVILTNNEIIPESNLLYKHAVEMETIVSNLGRFKQGHLCIYCGKVYSRKYGLKIHIRTHTGFKPLKCKYCMRPFGDPSNLNKHVRLHSEGDTPYKCEQCGKILVRKRDLDRHIKSRHYNSN